MNVKQIILLPRDKISSLGKTLLDEQDWYEKDLSDFDEPQLSDEEYEGSFSHHSFPPSDHLLSI